MTTISLIFVGPLTPEGAVPSYLGTCVGEHLVIEHGEPTKIQLSLDLWHQDTLHRVIGKEHVDVWVANGELRRYRATILNDCTNPRSSCRSIQFEVE